MRGNHLSGLEYIIILVVTVALVVGIMLGMLAMPSEAEAQEVSIPRRVLDYAEFETMPDWMVEAKLPWGSTIPSGKHSVYTDAMSYATAGRLVLSSRRIPHAGRTYQSGIVYTKHTYAPPFTLSWESRCTGLYDSWESVWMVAWESGFSSPSREHGFEIMEGRILASSHDAGRPNHRFVADGLDCRRTTRYDIRVNEGRGVAFFIDGNLVLDQPDQRTGARYTVIMDAEVGLFWRNVPTPTWQRGDFEIDWMMVQR